jgi:hypothetical protein
MNKLALNLLWAAALLLSVDNARAFYNPSTGRWMSRDPLGENGGINLYGFAANRPIDWVDTDGRDIRRGNDGPPGPPPTPPDPNGFALCMRDVNPEGLVEHLQLIGFKIWYHGVPTDHAYLHYKHCDKCERVGWGIGGTIPGAPPKQETVFNPTDSHARERSRCCNTVHLARRALKQRTQKSSTAYQKFQRPRNTSLRARGSITA